MLYERERRREPYLDDRIRKTSTSSIDILRKLLHSDLYQAATRDYAATVSQKLLWLFADASVGDQAALDGWSSLVRPCVRSPRLPLLTIDAPCSLTYAPVFSLAARPLALRPSLGCFAPFRPLLSPQSPFPRRHHAVLVLVSSWSVTPHSAIKIRTHFR